MKPHRAVIVFIIGLVSILVFPFLGPVAWYLGKMDLKEMRAGTMDKGGEGLTNVGMILGMCGTAFFVFFFCIIGLSILAIALLGNAASTPFTPVGK